MRRVHPALLSGFAALLIVPAAFAALKAKAPTGADPALVARGHAAFTRVCAPCHGQGPGDDGARHLPGTNALDARYKGAMPGALELRIDLSAETLRHFARHGSGPMPMFRKTEVSDADIDAIAAYIADNAAKARKAKR